MEPLGVRAAQAALAVPEVLVAQGVLAALAGLRVREDLGVPVDLGAHPQIL